MSKDLKFLLRIVNLVKATIYRTKKVLKRFVRIISTDWTFSFFMRDMFYRTVINLKFECIDVFRYQLL